MDSASIHRQDRPKVLIADDEPVIADALRTSLNRHQDGFEAVVVYDGQDAVVAARVWPPDILLTDVVMPILDGIEAASQICNMLPTWSRLLFSGDAGTSSMQYEAQARGHHFQLFQKPLQPEELLAVLRALARPE